MKKYTKVLALALALTLLLSMNVFAEGVGYTVTATGGSGAEATDATAENFDLTAPAADGKMYLLLVLDASKDEGIPTASNILYVNQATASGSTVVFDKVYPSKIADSNIYLAGGDLGGLTKIGEVLTAGFDVSGSVTSYNPRNATTIELKQGETVVKSAEIAATSGNGKVSQNFSIAGVANGTYDLVVSKAGHLAYTITGIKVDGEAVDLTKHASEAIAMIALMAGNANNDDSINNLDLMIVWSDENYSFAVEDAANAAADINDDGSVNNLDLMIVWSDVAYGAGAGDCVYAY